MIESVFVLCALIAAPCAALSAVLVRRWTADSAARFAATVVAVGSVAAMCLVPIRLMTSHEGTSLLLLESLGLNVDWLAVVVLMLVLGLSALIQFFAVRYLRGDARQRWFVVTANLVTASTAVMVCANTILGFGLSWVAAGASLVALLAMYSHLPQARGGARRTAISFVIGDLPLITALTLLAVSADGDVAFADLRNAMAALPIPLATVVAVLLVIPALARSSQVPFHGWLPATLAAPTPVSALMHAGVVNAGAILVLRFSPAIGESTAAMSLIFFAGALTLVYASAIRLIKPDVKGRLVFSTIAQMGFMMLACGMGAFAAAVFHLIAHGLFKATLFLGAGSGVAREAKQRAWPARQVTRWPQATAAIAVAISVPIGSIVAARVLLGVELSPASQALQLFVVLTAAVALVSTLWTHFSATTALVGSFAITGLAFGYTALITLFDRALAFGPVAAAVNAWWLLIPGVALIALQLVLLNRPGNGATRRLYALGLAAGTPTTRIKRQSIARQIGAPS